MRILQFISNGIVISNGRSLLRFIARYLAKRATAAFNFASSTTTWKCGNQKIFIHMCIICREKYRDSAVKDASNCGNSAENTGEFQSIGDLPETADPLSLFMT